LSIGEIDGAPRQLDLPALGVDASIADERARMAHEPPYSSASQAVHSDDLDRGAPCG